MTMTVELRWLTHRTSGDDQSQGVAGQAAGKFLAPSTTAAQTRRYFVLMMMRRRRMATSCQWRNFLRLIWAPPRVRRDLHAEGIFRKGFSRIRIALRALS